MIAMSSSSRGPKFRLMRYLGIVALLEISPFSMPTIPTKETSAPG